MDPLHPITRFKREYAKAAQSEHFDASRCALATVGLDGQPSLRFVLLKGVDETGFRFFTNYGSRKALEIAADPRVALCFHWHTTGQQVRVEGVARRVSTAESELYFHSRPRGSQLGAWASAQSQPVQQWDELSESLQAVESRFSEGVVPLPAFWGGYRVQPTLIEFWRDGDDRMHRREAFTAREDGWSVQRLWP
jgi:pyridoxamine 5'-phosphate oxidase